MPATLLLLYREIVDWQGGAVSERKALENPLAARYVDSGGPAAFVRAPSFSDCFIRFGLRWVANCWFPGEEECKPGQGLAVWEVGR